MPICAILILCPFSLSPFPSSGLSPQHQHVDHPNNHRKFHYTATWDHDHLPPFFPLNPPPPPSIGQYEPQEASLRLFEIDHLLSLTDAIVPAEEKKTLLAEAKVLIIANDIKFYADKLLKDDAEYTQIVDTITEHKKEKYAKFQKEIEGHEETGNDQDIIDVELQKVKYACAVLEDAKQIEDMITETLAKTKSNQTRIQFYFYQAKYALSIRNSALFNTNIDKLSALVEKDGDWDARNRFNAYSGLNNLLQGNFTAAAPSFISVIPTFSSTDIISLDDALILAMYLGVITLNRKDLISKLVESPEIIQTLLNHPLEQSFLQNLYECKYAKFYASLPAIHDALLRSPYMGLIAPRYLKEARVVAYRQFLTAYQIVKIDAFAKAFGVSPDFLEKDIASLIGTGRLQCTINAVDRVLELQRAHNKNTQFAEIITQADIIVNKVNKLTQQAKAM